MHETEKKFSKFIFKSFLFLNMYVCNRRWQISTFAIEMWVKFLMSLPWLATKNTISVIFYCFYRFYFCLNDLKERNLGKSVTLSQLRYKNI